MLLEVAKWNQVHQKQLKNPSLSMLFLIYKTVNPLHYRHLQMQGAL